MDVKPTVTFPEAIKLFFTRYTDFSTRSRRSEYWFACLFNMLAAGVIGAIIPSLTWVWSLATLIPGIAIVIRRLHDTGKSAWWILMGLIPLAGGIILLVYMCKDSQPEANQWGASPKY